MRWDVPFVRVINYPKGREARKYLRAAYRYGFKNSDDRNIKNGAVLVDDFGDIVSYGTNHFPPGVISPKVKEFIDRKSREVEGAEDYEAKEKLLLEKEAVFLKYINHAERDSIYNSARKGIRTEGLTMYCPWYACTDCARGIVSSGIKKVVGHFEMFQKTPDHWKDEIEAALKMMDSAGIKLQLYKGKIGEVKAMFFDRWEP